MTSGAAPGRALVARTSEVLADVVEGPVGTFRSTAGGPDVVLGAHEVHRAAAFRAPTDRSDYVAAHLLVRRAAAHVLPPDAPVVRVLQTCPGCGRDGHGRPHAGAHPGLHLSLAHTRGGVAAAAAWSPVGIDIEGRRGPDSGTTTLWAGTLSAAEQDVLRELDTPSALVAMWVRKEALVKVGAATLADLADVDLSAVPLRLDPGTGAAQRWRDWTFTDWSDDHYLASVVAAGPVRLDDERARVTGGPPGPPVTAPPPAQRPRSSR